MIDDTKSRNEKRVTLPNMINYRSFNTNSSANIFTGNSLNRNNYIQNFLENSPSKNFSSINNSDLNKKNLKLYHINLKKIQVKYPKHDKNFNNFVMNAKSLDKTENSENKPLDKVQNIGMFLSSNLKKKYKTIETESKNEAGKLGNLEKLKAYTKKKIFPKLKTILPLRTEDDIENKELKGNAQEDSKKSYTEIVFNDRIELVKTTLNTILSTNQANDKTKKSINNVNFPIINGKVSLNSLFSKEDAHNDKTNQFSFRIIEKNGEAVYEYYRKKTNNANESSEISNKTYNKMNNLISSDKPKSKFSNNIQTINGKASSVDYSVQNNLRNKSKNSISKESNCFIDQRPFFHHKDFDILRDKLSNRISNTKSFMSNLSDKMNGALIRTFKRIKNDYYLEK